MRRLPDPAPPDEPTAAALLTLHPPSKSPAIDRAKNTIPPFEATSWYNAERLLSTWAHTWTLSRREWAVRFDPTGASGRRVS
ncbi:hypothetical protein O7626_27640 [Micromonospora sp. WMMD1102]|uniref:hypothetical protein n=1 Tax=Micromonospora sp. WMMD1102 TaxID=3016105 RepID=UPI0024158212|nr:hypothetical protein [Micromonospora sp. WMMD1102]MDG4789653.1 hypothetical protein [Micromonospora sp. WMMD1102]